MFTISYEDLGGRQVLSEAEGRADDLTQAWAIVGAAIRQSTDKRFAQQVDPTGQPWAPLAPATAARKAKSGRDQILQETGRLRQSIETVPASDGVEIGTNLVYAAVHQFGGTRDVAPHSVTIYRQFFKSTGLLSNKFVKKSKSNFATDHEVGAHSIATPARPFLGITPEDIDNAQKIIVDYIIGVK